MKSKSLVAALVAVVAVGASLSIAASVSLEKVKCIVATSKDAKESTGVAWKDGKVYFCCNNCPKTFAADNKKFAAKANQQLVATKQYKQQLCVFTGNKLDDTTAIEVGATKVAFCCNNCKGKAEKLTGDEQIEQLFGEEAFKKGKFELVKAEK